MIKSRYKLTFSPASSPLVILDFNELIDADLKPDGSSGLDVIPLVRSDEPLLWDGANASYQFGFQVQRRQSTDALARIAMWDKMIAWAALEVAPLKIELADITTHYLLMNQCKIHRFTPEGKTVGLGLTLTQYTLTCAGLSKVTV